MFGLNYHHQPSGGGNISTDLSPDLSVDFFNLDDSDFFHFSINSSFPSASNISHNSTQTLDGPELSIQVVIYRGHFLSHTKTMLTSSLNPAHLAACMESCSTMS